jgi:hypothetical protein
MPLRGNFRLDRRKGILLSHKHLRTLRASVACISRLNPCLPLVTPLTHPPHLLGRTFGHVPRGQGKVPARVPFTCEDWICGIETGILAWPETGTVRAARPVAPICNGRFPFMTLLAYPARPSESTCRSLWDAIAWPGGDFQRQGSSTFAFLLPQPPYIESW